MEEKSMSGDRNYYASASRYDAENAMRPGEETTIYKQVVHAAPEAPCWRNIVHLTMRLSDAGLHQRQTKALNPNHRLPPSLIEDAAPRSLEPIVRQQHWVCGVEAKGSTKCLQ
jgi:hypothetical protein